MKSIHRLIVFAAVCAWVGVFQFGPGILGVDEAGMMIWITIPGLVSPFVAALACYCAAAISWETDRKAWRSFGFGCTFYFLGNLCYLYYGLYEIDAPFPTLPELSYFILALFFTIGMFQYGAARHLISRIQIYNFGLILCAACLSSAYLLHASIEASRLGMLGTIFAFVYPVLWFSVAGFGLVCLLLYSHRSKRVAFTLLLLAAFAEATADFLYAKGLMEETYRIGGLVSGLWLLSIVLVIWAAVEQMYIRRLGESVRVHVLTIGRRRLAEASVPAITVAIVLGSACLAAIYSGYGKFFLFFCGPAAVLFAILIGLREHWALSLERDLRDASRHSQSELAANQERLSAVLESTTDSVLVLDRQWRVVFCNGPAAAMIGEPNDVLLGVSVFALFPDEVSVRLDEHFKQVLASGCAVDFEQYLADKSTWLEVHAFPSPDGLSVFFRDISGAYRAREEITHLAHHDPLTGLANRLLFHTELEKGIASGEQTATLFLDLDHFKEVNDTLGHPAGDALLRQLADRLRACVRDFDTVGRIGGDEFAVILPGITARSEATSLAERILDDVRKPYLIDGQMVHVGASIGIAISPADGVDPDDIFRKADIALYCAKVDERGTYRLFEAEMELRLKNRQKLKSDLAAALGKSQFETVFQPIIDLHTNQVSCFEALLRWHHPLHGTIPPSVFIPIAEETGLIIPIGKWVLGQACAEACKWPQGIGVAVNLSTVQFGSAGLPAMVEAVLKDSGLSPGRLELEITESVLLRDSEVNLTTLQQIRALGVRIALDDFGTGYASLSYLQKFPFSSIKIDRFFITNLPDHRESQAIVVAITGLGRTLGIRITAEGVETRQQLDRVRRVGCDEAQGYFFSRPIAAILIPDLLKKFTAVQKFWGDASSVRDAQPEIIPRLPLGNV